MAKRGRKTAGELEAVESIPKIPDPPDNLNDYERDVWLRVTKGLPVDWFGSETLDQLQSYCRHMFMFEKLTDEITEKWDELPPAEKARLLKQREGESRTATSLATKMRITQQSTYDKSKVKTPGTSSAPWKMPGLK